MGCQGDMNGIKAFVTFTDTGIKTKAATMALMFTNFNETQ